MSACALPSWVVPAADEVGECLRVCQRRAERGTDARELGVLAALVWLSLGEAAPMTWRTGVRTREVVRAESWVALCVAAGRDQPTELDWRRLGVAARPAVTHDAEFGYGVWRALAWLLGVRQDCPTYTARHRAAGEIRTRAYLDVPVQARGSDVWRAAESASRDQARADALRYWTYVRALADAT